MIKVTPRTYLIGSTQLHRHALSEYLVDTGNEQFLDLLTGTDQMDITSFFAKLCYKALTLGHNENITQTRAIADNFIGCITSGHHSVLEHCNFNFVAENVSRVLHTELIRHRVGTAYSCIAEGTKILTTRPGDKLDGGKWVNVEELYDRYTNGITSTYNGKKYKRLYGRPVNARCYDVNRKKFTGSPVKNIFFNGEKEVIEITTESGKNIQTTLDHKFLSENFEWVDIKSLLDVEITGSKLAYFRNKNVSVATNGVVKTTAMINKQKSIYFQHPFHDKVHAKKFLHLTVKQISQQIDMSESFVKKWLRVHDLKCAKSPENNVFKKGHNTWNKNVTGYKMKLKNRKRSLKKAQNSISGARYYIADWTRRQLPELLKKYNYQCQYSKNCECKKFHSHHVIPVYVDESKALDFDNLILVCKDCHKKIHKSAKSEELFAKEKLGGVERFPDIVRSRPKTFPKRSLDVKFEKIVSVEYIGIKNVYDLEIGNENHNYVANSFVVHNCESGRFSYSPTLKTWTPSVFKKYPELEAKYLEVVNFCEKAMNEMYSEHIDKCANFAEKKELTSAIRRGKPMGCAETVGFSVNMRSARHIIQMRTSEHAEEEIRIVFAQVAEILKEQIPLLFVDAKIDNIKGINQYIFTTENIHGK